MEQDASAALIVSIVAVVLGGFGLVGGLIGYVQGAAALRRATLARQRAAAAEESALQAKAQADSSARAAERALDRLREMGVDPAKLVTGPSAMIRPAAEPVREVPPATGPTPLAAPRQEAPAADPAPVASSVPAVSTAAVPAAASPVSTEPGPQPQPEPEPGPEPEPESRPETEPAPQPAPTDPEPPQNARTSGGQVVAGEQESPPMDWAEALRTGSIPLPARSRGTYAAPRRSSKRTGEGPARFDVRAVGRQRFEAVNVGGLQAADAIVEGAGDDSHLVRPLAIGPTSVPPGGSLGFSVLRVDGRSVTALVRWRVDGETASQELPIE